VVCACNALGPCGNVAETDATPFASEPETALLT